jgi:hypothetical protein
LTLGTNTNKFYTFRDLFATKKIQGLKQKIRKHTGPKNYLSQQNKHKHYLVESWLKHVM